MVLIAFLCLTAYLPALDGQFIWDDRAHLTHPQLRSLSGLWHIWFTPGATQQYYPLLHSVFWIQYRLWGEWPTGYHLVNVFLHAINACLVLLIGRRLELPGAALAAVVFALHPVHVESVAWISEQKNTLSGVFYLSAMLIYLQFDQSRQRRLYWLALLMFLLGLASKTVTATLPAALLVILWWKRGRLIFREDVAPLLPWLAIGAGAGLFTALVEEKLIGAQGKDFELTLAQSFLLAGRAVWFYLGKLLWPTNLIFIYPRWELRPEIWWQWIYPVAAVAAITVLWLIRRWYPGPLAAALFFVGTLFPVLGFFNVYPFIYSYVADHFQYLASLAVICGVSAAMTMILKSAPIWSRYLLACALAAVLLVLSWRQSLIYADAQELYQATIDRNPGCWMAHNNLGIYLMDQLGQPHRAIECFQQVLRLKPDSLHAWVNLTKAYALVGRYSDAVTAAQEALKLARAANDQATVREMHDALKSLQGATHLQQ